MKKDPYTVIKENNVSISMVDFSDQISYIYEIEDSQFDPFFRKGETIAIAEQDDIEPGQFGVYIINGKQTVFRQKGYGVLRSLNIDIPDLPIDENVKCIGRILGRVRVIKKK